MKGYARWEWKAVEQPVDGSTSRERALPMLCAQTCSSVVIDNRCINTLFVTYCRV